MKQIFIVALAFFAYLSCSVQAQESKNLVTYDKFGHSFIDPSKWSGWPGCPSYPSWFVVRECVREIQNGQLRLAVRGYGASDSNQGNQYGPSELYFLDPIPVTTIAANLTVRRSSAAPCSGNAGEGAHAHALLSGSFFNSGSGDSADDVQAFLIFDHDATYPDGTLVVDAFLFWQGQFFGGVDLGTTNVGDRVIAQLEWDQANHRFVASWTKVGSGSVTKASMPYTMPDTTPPAYPFKLLGVRTFSPNCIDTRTFADMEATFDNVMINQ